MKRVGLLSLIIILCTTLLLFISSSRQTKKYTLTFEVDGSVCETILYTDSEMCGLPKTPQKAGYDFVGWFSDGDEYELFNENYFLFHELTNAHFKARFVESGKAIVLIKSNLGSMQEIIVNKNQAIDLSEYLLNGTYRVSNWYLDETQRDEVDINNFYVNDSFVSLYCLWEDYSDIPLAIDFYSGDSLIAHYSKYYNEVLETIPDVPERTGYVGAWSQTDFSKRNRDVVVQAIYTPKTYTLSFDYNGATGGTSMTNLEVTYGEQIGSLPNPTNSDLVFDGWFYSDTLFSSSTVWELDSSLTLKAEWSHFDSGHSVLKADAFTFGENNVLCMTEVLPHNNAPTTLDLNSYFKISNGSTLRVYSNSDCSSLVANNKVNISFGWNYYYGVITNNDTQESTTYEIQICRDPFLYKLSSNNTYSISYCENCKFVSVPSEYNSVPITSLNNFLFLNHTKLERISLSNNISIIPAQLFMNCDSLKEVQLPNSITAIRENAFSGCSSLESITLPNTVTELNAYAFNDCSSLKSITLSSTLTSISPYCFYNCSSLETITIPNGVTKLPYYLFYGCTSLKSVILPQNLSEIGNYVFSNCTSLESISFGNNLLSIGDEAFSNCTSLSTITLGDCVQLLGLSSFSGCSNLTSITLNDALETIKAYAFYNCTSLTNILFGSNISTLEPGCFKNCESLQSISIPDSVSTIGYEMFSGCSSLESVTLGSNVQNIGDSFFYGCTSLKTISAIGVTTIKGVPFVNCEVLERITLGDELVELNPNSNSTLFKNCSNSINIYYMGTIDTWCQITGLQYLNPSICHLYINNTLLTSASISSDVSIKPYAFSYLTDLTTLSITGSQVTILDYAFYSCSSLESIVISSSISELGQNVFASCSSLTSISLPNSLASISEGAFLNCTTLESINYSGTSEEWHSITISTSSFDGVPTTCVVYCSDQNTIIN